MVVVTLWCLLAVIHLRTLWWRPLRRPNLRVLFLAKVPTLYVHDMLFNPPISKPLLDIFADRSLKKASAIVFPLPRCWWWFSFKTACRDLGKVEEVSRLVYSVLLGGFCTEYINMEHICCNTTFPRHLLNGVWKMFEGLERPRKVRLNRQLHCLPHLEDHFLIRSEKKEQAFKIWVHIMFHCFILLLCQECVGTMWRRNLLLIFVQKKCHCHHLGQLLPRKSLQMKDVQAINVRMAKVKKPWNFPGPAQHRQENGLRWRKRRVERTEDSLSLKMRRG